MRKRIKLRERVLAASPTTRLIIGDCRDVLKTLPDESVHCVVTSPPYFGLRDYGTAKWEGGDPDCSHTNTRRDHAGEKQSTSAGTSRDSLAGAANCRHCGAIRVDRQIGLEPTPDAFVAEMVAVFREVRRVLRGDGTLWLNLGDSYASAWVCNRRSVIGNGSLADGKRSNRPNRLVGGLKEKDLIGIPWRVAFALQADGWYLRQDIIWSKPNPMPESVRDRCTKAHEYLFLLSKNERYWYDAEAIQEPFTYSGDVRMKTAYAEETGKSVGSGYRAAVNQDGRNKRSVWEITTQPFPEAHFATFPPALIEPCILAGTSARGCCRACGAPWRRVVERKKMVIKRSSRTHELWRTRSSGTVEEPAITRTVGWEPSCKCGAQVSPAVVLDPFGGAGTTGLVANRLGRRALLIELNAEYVRMSHRRVWRDAPLLNVVES